MAKLSPIARFWVLTTAALLVAALTFSLGQWQLRRAAQKQALMLAVEAQSNEAILKARVGLLNWNRTTNGASSRLPFGGMGKSGNDRPSAHFAVQYTTVPMASLEDPTTLDKTKLLPGVTLE